MLEALLPNRVLSKSALRLLLTGQIIVLLVFWQFATPPVIPKVTEVTETLGELWTQGFGTQIFTSVTLYIQALAIATIYSLLLSYSASLAFFRPLAEGWAKLRFLGMVGLPFIATYFLRGVHEIKLALLSFSISVFMVTGMLDVLASIPKEKYDLARTLRMNEWQVVWEVQVLGRFDLMWDTIRSNAAIGWMMLSMVEGLFKSEGGVGAMLEIQYHQFHLTGIFTICVTIVMVGILQDYLMGVVKNICCPYASMILERR